MNALGRIALWFASFVLSVILFSLLLSPLFGGIGSAFVIGRATIPLASPVWCLYLLCVIAFKDAEQNRIWIILLSGTLIGPVTLAIWAVILQLRGGDAHAIWQGDPLIGIGAAWDMVFAAIVGALAAALYGIALRRLHRRMGTAKG